MLNLIQIDIDYSQKTVSSFKKGSNCQNHSSSDFLHPVKKSPLRKISDSPATSYHYLENPSSMEQIFWQLQKAVVLKIFQAFSQK